MAERFYIWEDDERNGPYTERQLERMLEDRVIGFSHECEHVASGERIQLDELFEEVQDEEIESDDESEEEEEWEYVEEDEEEWEEDAEEEEGDEEGEWEEEEYEEEVEEEWEEEGADEDEEDALPPSARLYSGHPTIVRYTGALILALIGIAFGLFLGPRSLWFFIGGFGVAVFTMIGIVIDRSTRLYVVTPKRIELIWGLFAKSSNEVRIEDIRTINVRKKGFLGLLGIGTVEFSSTGDSIDVAFTDVWGAHKIKSLVREVQDELE